MRTSVCLLREQHAALVFYLLRMIKQYYIKGKCLCTSRISRRGCWCWGEIILVTSCFILPKTDLHQTYLWKWIMAQTRQIYEIRTLDAHHSGKGYKSISTELVLHQSTVRQIEETQGRCPHLKESKPTNITPTARSVIDYEDSQEPRGTSNHLKVFFTLTRVLPS